VLVGDGRKPLLHEIEDDPVGLLGVPFPGLPTGTSLGEEGSEGGGKPVEGDLKELDLLRRDVGR
jgi:hypothetical protein